MDYKQWKEIRKRFDALSADISALLMLIPSNDEADRATPDRNYLPGDSVYTEGRNAVALDVPHVHVLYEDGTIERRPLHCTARNGEDTSITLEQLTAARERINVPSVPREWITDYRALLSLALSVESSKGAQALDSDIAQGRDRLRKIDQWLDGVPAALSDADAQKPVAWVPMHPKKGPVWSYTSERYFECKWPLRAVYLAPPPAENKE